MNGATVYILVGYSTLNNARFGFKVVNASIYGTMADGTNTDVTGAAIHTIGGAGEETELEAVLTAESQCEFYINGAYKDVLSAHPPNVGSGATQRIIEIKTEITLGGGSSWFRGSFWSLLQEP